MVTFYGYDKCSTCRHAKRTLQALGVAVTDVDITTRPPSRQLLAGILALGDYTIQDLFNRSGELYRALDMKSKMASMSQAQLLDLLAAHGKLIKRPIITDGRRATVGFDEARIRRIWGR